MRVALRILAAQALRVRFAVSSGLVALASFASGYALMRSVEPLPLQSRDERAADLTSTAGHSQLVTDAQISRAPRAELLAAMAANQDELAQEHQLFVWIEALDAAGLRTLFHTSQLKELRENLKKLPADTIPYVLRTLIRRWLELDAAAMLAWLPRANIDFPESEEPVYQIIAAVAQSRPGKAVEFLAQLAPGQFRERVADQLFEQLATSDPKSAREFLRRFSDSEISGASHRGFQKGLCRSDPLAAIALAKAIPDEKEREAALQMLGRDLERHSPAVIAEVFRSFGARDPTLTLTLLADVDPKRAAQAVGELLANRSSDQRQPNRWSYVSIAGKEFGRTAPREAVAWALALPDDVRSQALAAVSSGWARINPREALLYLDEHLPRQSEHLPGEGASRSDPRIAAFQEWVRADDTAARSWADALPRGDLRNAAQAALLLNLAHQAGRSDEVLRRANTLAPEEFKTVALEITQALAHHDARATVDWALQLARKTEAFETVEISVEHWFVSDPHAAAAWVEALPPGSARDAGAAACARIAISLDAMSASEWVEQIGDRQRRETAAQQVATEWKKRDAAAADGWLAAILSRDPNSSAAGSALR